MEINREHEFTNMGKKLCSETTYTENKANIYGD